MPSARETASVAKTALGYAAMIAGTIASLLWIQRLGAGAAAPPPPLERAVVSAAGEHFDSLLHVLLALLVILVASRLIGVVFRRFGQPAVIGEVVAGILLGPSLLGRVAPEAYAFLLPPTIAPFLQVISQVGVILYMFLVGLELDPTHIRRNPHTALAVSHASIVAPFLLGSGLALWLYPRFSTSDVSFSAFSLFIGVSMSVTAFPVLARILTDRGMQGTPLGSMALTCAAVDDATAWCLLAFVVSVVQARGESAIGTVALTGAFIVCMGALLRPALVRLARHVENAPGRLAPNVLAVVFALLLGSALATEWIGLHALFGAFLLGVVIPHESRLARDLRAQLEDLVVVLLLPAFFAYSGMRTQIQLVTGIEQWLVCGLILLVACAGKFGGSAAAARLSGYSWRGAAALGVLMNTRGLVELIVLNIGLDLGVISPTLFAMLVIMALVTTFATSPLLDRITGGAREGSALAVESERI